MSPLHWRKLSSKSSLTLGSSSWPHHSKAVSSSLTTNVDCATYFEIVFIILYYCHIGVITWDPWRQGSYLKLLIAYSFLMQYPIRKKSVPGGAVVNNLPASRRPGFNPRLGRYPGGGPVFLPGKSHGPGTWQATVHGVTKSQTSMWAYAHMHTEKTFNNYLVEDWQT